ncbi:probable pectinesterase 55 [Panicum virgatum]|nr:probable pectinesterase 55 [Panicum virgatum]
MALAVALAVLASMAAVPRGRRDAAATVVRTIFVNRNGSADFESVQHAVDSVPFGNDQWIRVHVAAGVYNEKVTIPQNKSFILLEGEGRQQTSIEWADHAGGDSSTAASPTFAAYSADFMARDITFKNLYGGDGGLSPAVAALVSGDRSSFYRCGFVGVQDTLGDMGGRHYYEGCYILGAMDFIFGDGQSIFQGCDIRTAPTPVSPGFITAQGRQSEADTSGFVFRGCTVRGDTPAYLGRAWRRYARVIFYRTDMSGVVVGQGWDAWSYKGMEDTLTMVEAGCTGQGSNRTERAPWTKALSDGELAKFVDLSYISGDGWLDAQPR